MLKMFFCVTLRTSSGRVNEFYICYAKFIQNQNCSGSQIVLKALCFASSQRVTEPLVPITYSCMFMLLNRKKATYCTDVHLKDYGLISVPGIKCPTFFLLLCKYGLLTYLKIFKSQLCVSNWKMHKSQHFSHRGPSHMHPDCWAGHLPLYWKSYVPTRSISNRKQHTSKSPPLR